MPDPSFLPFLLLFAMVTLRPSLRCLREPEPANIRAGVKAGVLGLVLLDAAFAAGYGGPLAGLLVALLIVPSALIARAFAVT